MNDTLHQLTLPLEGEGRAGGQVQGGERKDGWMKVCPECQNKE